MSLSYLKWALGVHRKASNIGVWGESGRNPLIYQSIRLTLNYFQRILSANPDSLVLAALREQKSMKLPWYNNIKPLLKVDEIYSLVTTWQLLELLTQTKIKVSQMKPLIVIRVLPPIVPTPTQHSHLTK